ncbi:nucleotide-binding oligomerization domain-containing protein 2 isoform X2 [Neoarius graeffei]|uniref:nucleotide-binding oligomerization domain-containing protein 2 isoform X2 n=1 Tax=Neoarius graeffei TaxID=443677 RepID=UPI00298D3B6E|nr:nucleotide-binding oligomerization domain-containing protein 2 isoform X2 [Neoarius graeffei]
MCAQQLVLRQRAELLGRLCCGGTAEPLDSVLDLLLSWDVLVWEDYHNVQGLTIPLCSKTRDLLDLVYNKGEEACSLLLAAFDQVLPESQKAGLCFGKGNSGRTDIKRTPKSATEALLIDRPALVKKIRDHLDGVLDALMDAGCFTSQDCDEVLLPVYTCSQKVRKLLDQVRFKGESAANTLLQYLQQINSKPQPKKEEKQLSTECLLYKKKLCSSVAAQSHFLSTYGGTGRFSLDDIYTDGLLEVVQSDREVAALGLQDVVGQLGTINEEADTILVSGEAGTGKSTLLQRLHLLWARGTLLTDILMLFPFSCRKLNAEQRMLSLKELLFLHCCWPDRGQDEIFQFIVDHPHQVLFTFDGLDEFRQSFTDEERHCCPTQQAPVHTLLCNLLQGTLMKGVKKVITSRPQAVGPSLKWYLRKEVLAKGFSPVGIDHFVRKHHNDTTVATQVVESLKANTALLGLCHIPVFCWIVSKCYKELLGCGDGSPQTVTDVYLMVLKHFFQKQVPQKHRTLGQGWLQEHLEMVRRLGQLALEGLETSCYVFTESNLQKCSITEQDIGLGFLIHCKDLSDFSDCKHFEFLHITMQCFFAALYIVLNNNNNCSVILNLFQSPCQQPTVLNHNCLVYCMKPVVDERNVAETPNLQITSEFVAGLLSQRYRSLLTQSCPAALLEKKSNQVMKCLSKGIQRHFKSIPPPVKGEKKSMHAMPSFVWLIKCIYEMQESKIAQGAVAKLEVEHLKLIYCNIGPVECTALAYVLRYLQNPVGIQLDFNSVGDVGLEQLLPCLHICHSLYLRHNNISDEGIRKLVEKAVHCECFKKVALFNNKLTDECTKYFAWLLKTKKNFLALRLGNNNITSQGAEQLAEGLRLWGNKIGDSGAEALADALKDSTTLIWLSLANNCVGSAGACALAELIKRSTTLLELWLNQNSISRDGVDCLIEALKVNSTVKEVWLGGNNLSAEEVKELREKESRLVF